MLAVILAMTTSLAVLCTPAMADSPKERVRFFSLFVGYSHPLQLKVEVSQEQAKNGTSAYYVAHYDEDGNNVRIEKYYKGRLEVEYAYSYSDSGKLTDIYVTGPDGERNHLNVPERK